MRVSYFLESIVCDYEKVVSLIYSNMEEMEEEDVAEVVDFLDDAKEESVNLILHGDGGNLGAALTLGVYLRNKFRKQFNTIVVSRAASANGYIALLSDQLIMAHGAYLTQFDLAFLYKDRMYRALNELESENPVIKRKAGMIWGLSFRLIREIIDRKNTISKRNKICDDYIREIMDVCMKKSSHSKKISCDELKMLDFNVREIVGESAQMLKMFVDHVLKELDEKEKRFFVSYGKEFRFF